MATMLQLLKKSGLKASEAKRINDYLKSVGVEDVAALENSPPVIGSKLFGHDIYSLIHAVVKAANAPDDPAPVKKKPVKEIDNGENNQAESAGD